MHQVILDPTVLNIVHQELSENCALSTANVKMMHGVIPKLGNVFVNLDILVSFVKKNVRKGFMATNATLFVNVPKIQQTIVIIPVEHAFVYQDSQIVFVLPNVKTELGARTVTTRAYAVKVFYVTT